MKSIELNTIMRRLKPMLSWRYFITKNILFPFIRQSLSTSVVPSKTMNSRLDQNQSVFSIFVLATLLQMSSDVHSLLNQAVNVFRYLRSASYIKDDGPFFLRRRTIF